MKIIILNRNPGNGFNINGLKIVDIKENMEEKELLYNNSFLMNLVLSETLIGYGS